MAERTARPPGHLWWLAALAPLGLVALGAPPAQAAGPVEEPRFEIRFEHQGQGEGFSFRSTTTTTYRLCDAWDGGRWGVAPAGAAAGPSLLDDLGITSAAGAGLPGRQSTATPRGLFALRRSLLGLKIGEALPFCIQRETGGGTDGRGSTSSWDQDERGNFRMSGVEVDGTERRPFSTSTPAGDDPGRNAQAELVRTARGARLTFSVGGGGGGEGTDIGSIEVGSLALDEAQRQALGRFDLTERELADWSRLSRTASVTGRSDVGQLSIAMHLTVEQPDLGEVSVEAEGYDDWRPLGNLQDQERPGNELVIRAWVHKTGAPDAPSDRKVRLTFELDKVSTMTGVCNNGPPDGAGTGDDLRILQDRNPALVLEAPGRARTRDLVGQAKVTVSSFDYGAWGQLVVTAEDTKGRKVPVRIEGKDHKVRPSLAIPKDDDENHIADAWQERHGVVGRSAREDLDAQPAGNGFAGDGLTLYEEYRGFQVRGAWLETDPKRKDLFICDESQLAQKGIVLFGQISDLDVHRLSCLELGSDRVVNRHGLTGPSVVLQHGLRIEANTKGGDASNESAEGADDEAGPPRTSARILIPAKGSGGKPGSRAAQDWDAVVAHEIGHGVGIRHHGEAAVAAVVVQWVPEPVGWRGWWQAPADTRTGAQRENLARVTILEEATGKPFEPGGLPPEGGKALGQDRWLIWVLGKQSPASGVETCVMRYLDRGLYQSSRLDRTFYVPDPSQWQARTRLCGGSEGTGVNAPDHLPESRYGPAALGDCKGQIVVNDLYRGQGR